MAYSNDRCNLSFSFLLKRPKFADSIKLIWKNDNASNTATLPFFFFFFFFFFLTFDSGYFLFGNRDDGNRNDKNYVNSHFSLLSWCKNLKYFAKIWTSPSYFFSVWDYLVIWFFSILLLSKIWVTELTNYLSVLNTDLDNHSNFLSLETSSKMPPFFFFFFFFFF